MNQLSIDELEVLTPDQLGQMLLNEVRRYTTNFKYIQDILYVGCPIDHRNDNGDTPLHYASYYGNFGILKYLLSKGAEVNVRNNQGETPLHMALNTNPRYLELIKFLISNGADVNARSRDGRTALHFAAMDEEIELVEFLISKGAEVNAITYGGDTALCLAAVIENHERMRLLIYAGAQLNINNESGITILDRIISPTIPNKKAVRILILYGINIKLKNIFDSDIFGNGLCYKLSLLICRLCYLSGLTTLMKCISCILKA